MLIRIIYSGTQCKQTYPPLNLNDQPIPQAELFRHAPRLVFNMEKIYLYEKFATDQEV